MLDSELVDFHCHLNRYPDHATAVAECEQAGVSTLTVTTTPKEWPRNRQLAAATHHVRAALGLDPRYAAECINELSLWEEYLPQTSYIGEVGLDGGEQYFRSLDLQKQIFQHVLQTCTRAGGKILSVHSYRSAEMVLDMIEEYLPPANGRVVLHWFTGGQNNAIRAVELGCYFSINAAMLAKDYHRSMVAALPLDRLLTETDGPFTRTTTRRPTRPTDVKAAVEALAKTRSADPASIAQAIRSNLWRLLSEGTDSRISALYRPQEK